MKLEPGTYRRATRAVCVTLTAVAFTLAWGALRPTASAAAGCSAIGDGQSSGWCGLYPGNAVGNIQEQGQVTLSADGTLLTVAVQNAGNGVVPDTAFVCLAPGTVLRSAGRLQDIQCQAAGGIWLPFGGGSESIDLNAYPQLLNTEFTVQLAANRDANDANGDAFYNNFDVTSSTGGGITPS